MDRSSLFVCALLLCATFKPLSGQVPDQLAHAIPAPETGAETGIRQGDAVALSADYLVVGAPLDDLSGDDSGAVRVYDATTGTLLHTIPNPDPDDIEDFGGQVALSGDRLVIGGDESFLSVGSTVHLYDLGGATPTVPQFSFDDGGSSFGDSFAIDGDRLVIAAPEDLLYYVSVYNVIERGQLYVYDLAGATPGVPVLIIDGPTDGGNLGACLALDENLLVAGSNSEFAWVYDLDGVIPETPIATLEHPDGLDLSSSADIKDPYVIISLDWENNNGGAAYVFDLSLLNPSTPLYRLQAPVPQTNGNFGRDVVIATTKVVVSALDTEASTTNNGAVFIYDLLAVDPTIPIQTIENPSTGYDDWFGESIALSGAQLLVGSPFESSAGFRTGKSYVFDLNGATPETPILELSDTGPDTRKQFGQALSMSGDFLAVGAPLDNATATGGGSVALFDLAGGTPTLPLFTAQHPDPQDYANFGQAVSLNGRYLAVSAPEQDLPSENDAGTVYIFDTLASNPATPIQTLEPESPDRDYSFGDSLALNDNWIAVGAPKLGSTFSSGGGRVTVYDFSDPSTPAATLTETSFTGNAFGTAVALDGDRLAVGAVDNALEYEGAVYVYDLGGVDPTTPAHDFSNPNPPLDPLSPLNEGRFGSSVALSGDWLAVGGLNAAHLYDLGAPDPAASIVKVVFIKATIDDTDIPYTGSYRVALDGSTLVVAVEAYDGFIKAFDLSTAQPFEAPVDLAPGLVDLSDYTRLPLAISGARVAASVPQDNQAGFDNGVVYIFDRSPTPEIAIDAKGQGLQSGSSTVRIGLGTIGVPSAPVEVTIRNVGGAPLTGLAVSKVGPQAGDFVVDVTGMAAGLVAGDATTFEVTFNATGTSLRQAQLQITSNDADENPFIFNVVGWSLSISDDTDGDGLNDLAEWNLAPLGFDWQESQPALVGVLMDNANSADLFSSSQIGALSINGVLEEDASDGTFLLTVGVRKSTDHETYGPLPMSDSTTRINGDGKLEFQFSVPEDTAFFELEAD